MIGLLFGFFAGGGLIDLLAQVIDQVTVVGGKVGNRRLFTEVRLTRGTELD